MNGLDTILSKIEKDSNEKIADIQNAANAKIEDIMSDAVKEAEAEKDAVILSAEKTAKQIIINADSACDAMMKKAVLEAKADIINNWCKAAETYFSSLQDDKYFDNIKKLVVKYHHLQNGVMHFNETDLNRLPSNFIDEINSLLEESAKLTLSDKSINIDAGFVLEYDDIFENCSVLALLDEKKDDICDSLFTLFKA